MSRAVFSLTLLGSALLVFQVQPMSGKALLPTFGGSPSTWAVCMVFFQSALLLGYLAAHQLARTPLRVQVVAFLALLIAALLALPGAPPAPVSELPPTLAIAHALASQIGMPFVALSMTAPLLSSWYARSIGREPFALYAASNLGSMLGLLGYPLLVEPALELPRQTHALRIAFAMVVVGASVAAWLAWRERSRGVASASAVSPERATHAPSLRQRARWLLLAAVPSALLLAVTNHVTTDVAAVPFLWVLPLALYLATFILTFGSAHAYRRPVAIPLWVLASAATGAALLVQSSAPGWLLLGAPLLTLTVGALCCHGELSRSRPEGRYVTSLYSWIATGGALGSSFVALLAPTLFDAFHELPIAIVATYALLVHAVLREPSARRAARDPVRSIAFLGTGLVVPLVLVASFAQSQAHTHAGHVLAQRRSFHGLVRVTELEDARVLTHGRIRHGMQWRDPGRAFEPTLYFGSGSGAGLVLTRHAPGRPRMLGVIGLGAGTLASYGRAGDRMRFYELSPDVALLARTHFGFLGGSAARIEVTLADGRLALERELSGQGPHAFDVLVLDAFASDSVPVHLLTHEAFALYARHLRPDGVLLVHVSNRYLDLERVVGGSAQHIGYALRVHESAPDDARGLAKARWALLARDARSLDALLTGTRARPLAGPPVHWTDRFSNVLGVLRGRIPET